MTVDPFPDIRAADDLADTSRFAVVPVPDEAGLAGQVRLVVERATDRRWFVKAATAEFDAANEVICGRLAQALGLARPRARFVAGRGDLVLIQHVADQPDEGELLAAGVDIAGEPSLFGPDEAALGRLAQDLADPTSLVGELLVAFLVDNDDGGNDRNWLVLSLAGRAPLKRIVAIDQGFALLGPMATGEHRRGLARGTDALHWGVSGIQATAQAPAARATASSTSQQARGRWPARHSGSGQRPAAGPVALGDHSPTSTHPGRRPFCGIARVTAGLSLDPMLPYHLTAQQQAQRCLCGRYLAWQVLGAGTKDGVPLTNVSPAPNETAGRR
jgi:hypothetical protein